MTQDEKLDYLIDFFKKDSIEYKDMEVTKGNRRMVLRSLMNVRIPKSIPNNVLKIHDDYLQEEAREKGIVELDEIPTVRESFQSKSEYADKISIWQGDITRLEVDAIVNAANSQMLGCFVPCHKCIDNAIHSSAGIELREECNHYMKKIGKYKSYEEPTGSAIITSAYNLPCKHVIHTVGPIVGYKLTNDLRNDLRSCYESCLKIASENGVRSIAFCCISTGEFNFPNDEAAKIAVETVITFLREEAGKIDRVIFNVFKDLDKEIYELNLH
ncbi:protein-ADP-ribose hydrolase [[Clostridium] fimetarium]|uniref:O-acetyl-ADP-ribose deacetylase (Regulator of RNase III), contains Macro domain n=1 Tax=[Clostridium] fimetarium TaxID=99656 RepID=A0A1I0RPJ9_9FIRM|nr:protein-ADP-ribose hydrolase [[Clostridium] fimetarium]SEW43191.1 O-acetyl-ADP-ribose deacetylase (regulator of RNase III), contains Macro domain [[Clostridium] fimetarium]